MYGLFNFLFIISLISVVVWCISRLLYNKGNTPTWNGIIISAIIGMLPCYLFLCFFGILGEKRNEEETQSERRSYSEEMRRRYEHNHSPKKNRNWYKYAFVALLILFILHILNDDSDEPIATEYVESPVIDTIKTDIPEMVVKPIKRSIAKPSQAPQQTVIKNVETIQSNTQSSSLIDDKNERKADTEKSTLELLEEQQHANVVKQAKEAGVSTEGSTLEILERIQRKMLESY